MGNTRDTGYLRNLVAYDASGNIVLPANLTVTGSIVGYATTSYVTTQINNLINGAPGLLDTLDELAAALGDDANFASTITTSIAGRQAALNGTGFVKISGTTISYDNSTYLTTSSASSTYLPLVGGTLTGALGGTSASFSSSVTASQYITTSTGANGIVLNADLGDANNSGRLFFIRTGGEGWAIFNNSGNLSFRNGAIPGNTSGSSRFTIDSTGAATFTNTITAEGGLIKSYSSNSNAFVDIDGSTSGVLGGIRLYSSGSAKWILSHSLPSTYRFSIGTATGLTTFTERFGIDHSTGATTITAKAPDADRTIPLNVLTLTAEQGNAPYGGFGGSILFKNRSYTSGLVDSARIRSVIYDDGAPNNFGGGLWFETTPTPGGTLTPSVVINYQGRVGMGTTTPGYKLDVNGDIRTNSVLYTNDNGPSFYQNRINAGWNTIGDSIDLWINYEGYLNDLTYFRDFRVGNGKRGASILFIDGSAGTTTFSGSVSAPSFNANVSSFGTDVSVNSTIRVGSGFSTQASIIFGDAGTPYWNIGRPAGSSNFSISSYALTALTIQPTTGNIGIGTGGPYNKLDVRGAIAMGNADSYPKNVRFVKQGTTTITFNALTGVLGAWRPGHAFIKVSGGQNGLQEYWAAWFYVRIIAYFASSAIMTVVDSGGDTGSVTFSSSSDQNNPQAMNFILTDNGGTTNTMIADIDFTYNEGIISIS
jgi:hypothetical protein